MGRLDGKVAIITGAARGQGAEEARLFVSEGARVLLCDVRDAEGEAVAADLGAKAVYQHLDVSDEAQWRAAVTRAKELYGGLTVVVNNAGIARTGTIENGSMEDLHRMIAVNQIGSWLGMRTSAAALRDSGGGSIVNVSSTAAFWGGAPGLAAYGMTKWALRGMTKSAALEFARDRIRVNSVHPGIIVTPMLTEGSPLGQVDYGSRVPAGRPGQPIDVANVVLFLASDESDYCTGAEFVVDGGLVAGSQTGGG